MKKYVLENFRGITELPGFPSMGNYREQGRM